MDERTENGAMLNLESGDRIELFYEDSPEATIRATVNRLTKWDPPKRTGLFVQRVTSSSLRSKGLGALGFHIRGAN
jgi:hypothetical protein